MRRGALRGPPHLFENLPKKYQCHAFLCILIYLMLIDSNINIQLLQETPQPPPPKLETFLTAINNCHAIQNKNKKLGFFLKLTFVQK